MIIIIMEYLTRKHVRDLANYDFNFNPSHLLNDIKNKNIKKNSTIICLPHTVNELKKLLDKITIPVILLFTDHNTQSLCISFNNSSKIADHEMVKHIFAENWYDEPHPKVTQVPIGISYKDIFLGKLYPALHHIEKNMTLNKDKPLKVLCNAHKKTYPKPFSGYIDDRKDMIDQLKDSSVIDFCTDKHNFSSITLITCWKKHEHYAFELSPSGNGLDCHRTYEAIILNTIPIVRSNTLDPIFKENKLPVVIVKEWNEVTQDNLKIWHEQYKDWFSEENKRKVRVEYWKDLITGFSSNDQL